MDNSLTSSFCVCENASESDACPCADVSSLSLDPDLHHLLWSGRSGGVLNDGRMNYRHPLKHNVRKEKLF